MPDPRPAQPVVRSDLAGPRYKWTALTNTSLGMFMALLDATVLMIALPEPFSAASTSIHSIRRMRTCSSGLS